jgi:hypothetical protein
LQSDVEWAPVGERGAERPGGSVVNPVRKERAMKKPGRAIAECKCAVELQPVSLRAIDV